MSRTAASMEDMEAALSASVQDILDTASASGRYSEAQAAALYSSLSAWVTVAGQAAPPRGVGAPLAYADMEDDDEMEESNSLSRFWAALAELPTSGEPAHRLLVKALAEAMSAPGGLSLPQFGLARCYLMWLQVPGAAAYGIVDAHALTSAAFVLSTAASGASSPASMRGRKKSSKSSAPRTLSQRAPKRGASVEDPRDDGDADENDAADDDQDSLPQPACAIPLSDVNSASSDLLGALRTVAIPEDAVWPVVQSLAALLVVEARLGAVQPASAACMSLALERFSSDVCSTARKICRALLPILLDSSALVKDVSTEESNRVRAAVLSTITSMLTETPSTAGISVTAPAIATLLQHLCVSTPERADPRAAVRSCILAIVQRLPRVYQRHFVRFLVRLSKNKKALLRLLAVELAAGALMSLGADVLCAGPEGQTQPSPSVKPPSASPQSAARIHGSLMSPTTPV